MANSNGWGDGSVNNNIGWGQGANNTIGWGKSQLDSWSGATDIDGGNLPSNSVAPAITGTAQEGQTLSCSTGTWSGSPTYTYQWKRNGNNIGGATSSTYLLVLADVGQNILCTVTATNFVGSATANSNTVTPTSSVDADAQAFITAASITDPTQQSAINQLVVDLKGYNIWTKFSAIYPFVGGTATTHKFNLKNPLDTNAAFRLSFLCGWTHSSTGAKPNGTNAYADTFYVPNTHLTDINSNHISFYSRTNAQGGIEMGGGPVPLVDLALRYGVGGGTLWNMASNANIAATLDSRYFLINTRTASNLFKFIKNGSVVTTSTGAAGTTKPNVSYYIGKRNYPDGVFSTLECAFASIGDGLNDTEAANLYTAVQAFQTTLGRSIGTQSVSDADAQAFVTNAGIVDQVEANAVNNLVIGLKADGLWTKMKALYPMVGGSSSTMKYNLKNPLDTDAAFRLVFSGGWTFSSNGATPNGTNAYADTKLNDNIVMALNNAHVSYYSRTQSNGTEIEIGVDNSLNILEIRTSGITYARVHGGTLSQFNDSDSRAFYIGNRTASNLINTWRNGIKQNTNTTNQAGTKANANYYIGASNSGSPSYSTKQCAFASIGDGLSDAEATNLYNRVQTFNTALARQV